MVEIYIVDHFVDMEQLALMEMYRVGQKYGSNLPIGREIVDTEISDIFMKLHGYKSGLMHGEFGLAESEPFVDT